MRIPAGVRVAGRSYGGRFVTMRQLRALVTATNDVGRVLLLDHVGMELERSARAVARFARKFNDDPKRYAGRLHDAETQLFAWQDAADKLVDRFTETRVRRRAPAAPPPLPPPPTVEPLALPEEDYATEWEVGCEYFSAGGAQSNVDINIRIRRTDSAMMSYSEARDVMAALLSNYDRGHDNPVPSGYRVAGVDWRRPSKGSRGWFPGPGWKSGGRGDLDAFQNVLYIAAGDGAPAKWRGPQLRYGAVDDSD